MIHYLLAFILLILIIGYIDFQIKTNHKVIEREHNVYVSFTTTPSRIDKTKNTIDSLLDQTYSSNIIINIPKLSYKGEPYIIPKWMETYNNKGKIIINNIDKDYGPGTKLIGALEKITDPEAIIIYLDDDYSYGKTLIETLVYENLKYPNSVSAINTGIAGKYTIASACFGVVVKRKLITDEIFDIPSKSCERGDDLWISLHFINKNIDIRTMFSKFYILYGLLWRTKQGHSYEKEARGDSKSNEDNYSKCLQDLGLE